MRNIGVGTYILRTMIEFCTKKRMILAISFMIGISVLVLVIENNVKWGHSLKEVFGNSSRECWAEYRFNIVEECQPCSDFDMKAQPYCNKTGYSEIVECLLKNGSKKRVNRSCPRLSWVEERNFWIFEGMSMFIGVVSYGVVCLRQKRLDKMLLEKVHKQIAAGV